MPTHINLRMVTFYKLQDTTEVRDFELDPAFVGKRFEQSHIRCTHNQLGSNQSPVHQEVNLHRVGLLPTWDMGYCLRVSCLGI